MPKPKRDERQRWLRTEGTFRQSIITLVECIHTLKRRGCGFEALKAEHEAVELMLRHLWTAVIAGRNRVEVIELLNTLIDFCATHFADEENVMHAGCSAHISAHATAHKILLAKFVDARRSATGEGLSLAVLNASDLLQAFHDHVKTYDQYDAETQVRQANQSMRHDVLNPV